MATKNVLLGKDVLTEKLAVKELQKLILAFNFEKVEDYKILEDYPQVVTAIKKGLLVFDEKNLVPKYNLAFPVIKDSDETSVKVVNFRTRIKPLDMISITKGLNMAKQQQEYILICLSYLSGLSKGELNLIEKFDYKVIEQVSTIFF